MRGPSRGLGQAMALQLADAGVDIIATYVVDAPAAAEVVAQVQAKGRKAVALQLDVANPATFEAFATSVRSHLATWNRERFD